MSNKPADFSKGIPGVPMAALNAIQDQNTRQVLRAIVDGWNVRNGSAGDGKNRFVTANELGGVSSAANSALAAVSSPPDAGRVLSKAEINRVITDLEASVMESLLWKELGTTITRIKVDTSQNAATIQNEVIQRINADNAIVQQTNTQFTVINGNLAALQTQQTTMSNNVAALAQSVTTLQADVGKNSVALQQEMTVRANADNDIYAKYSVKIDNNGYVTGFGLMSTANNSVPFSEFLVRADRFAIGSPSGPGVTPTVPFIVTTTPDAKGNPPGVYMRSTMIANASIGTAKIDDLAVNTLKIAGEAVIVPRFGSQIISGVYIFDGTWTGDVAAVSFTVSGLQPWEVASVSVIAVMQAYPTDGATTNLVMGIFANGGLLTDIASTYGGNGISMADVGQFSVPNGTHTASVRVTCRANPSGASSKAASTFFTKIIVMTAKR